MASQNDFVSKLGPNFARLQDRYKDLRALGTSINMMYWDQSTYLPEKGADSRGTHLAILQRMRHELATAKDLGAWLDELSKSAQDLPQDSDEASFIRVAREDFERQVRIPASLEARLSNQTSIAYETWKKARAANDFGIVASVMEKTLEISREYANCLKEPHHTTLMDPMIDLADPGFTEQSLKPLFKELRSFLVPLTERIVAAGPFDNACLLQDFPENEQLEFGKRVISTLGFDFERGRQDMTAHPFMIRFASSDVRITTRVKRRDLNEALFSTIHEAGHALYELGIDPRFENTPLGEGSSSGIHESQSRLWENQVGRGLPFWEHFYPKLQEAFPRQLGSVPLLTFYRAINRVERSLIRTDADEVTYNLHVMIRFDLESDLHADRLKIRDLPDAWNERYRTDLGLVPKNLSEGVLQDVHWFHGPIGGGFQGYTIGNILSAQLFESARRAHPDLEDQFRAGDFSKLREWLKTQLHQFGRKFPGPDLIHRATGAPLATKDYFKYLERKYSDLL